MRSLIVTGRRPACDPQSAVGLIVCENSRRPDCDEAQPRTLTNAFSSK